MDRHPQRTAPPPCRAPGSGAHVSRHRWPRRRRHPSVETVSTRGGSVRGPLGSRSRDADPGLRPLIPHRPPRGPLLAREPRGTARENDPQRRPVHGPPPRRHGRRRRAPLAPWWRLGIAHPRCPSSGRLLGRPSTAHLATVVVIGEVGHPSTPRAWQSTHLGHGGVAEHVGCVPWAEPGPLPSTRARARSWDDTPASKIHPWRTSGVNRPGYSRPPAPPQQASAAPHRLDDDWDYDAPTTVSLGKPLSLSQFLAAQATAAKWGPPAGHLEWPALRARPCWRRPRRLPGSWEIFIARSTDGIETAYGLDDNGVLHLVMLRGDGTPAEMVDVPDQVLDHIRDWAFPGGAS